MQHTNLELAIILVCILIAACCDILNENYRHYDHNKHTVGLPALITIIVLAVSGLIFIGWRTFMP